MERRARKFGEILASQRNFDRRSPRAVTPGLLRKTQDGMGDPLFDALRAMRRELAAEAGVPPYVIFHDAALRAMASERPRTRAELAAIPGVGAKKLEAWGDAFLEVIGQF